MKTVLLTCDGCGWELSGRSAAVTVFNGSRRKDFCTEVCYETDSRRRLLGGGPIELRPARTADSRRIWEWANDPQTRSNSFDSSPIAWEDHQKWFAGQSNIYVGWLPVGTVRLEDDEISVNVAPSERGRGFGSQLIQAVTQPNTTARIKETNRQSLRSFASARYTEVSREDGVVTMVRSG